MQVIHLTNEQYTAKLQAMRPNTPMSKAFTACGHYVYHHRSRPYSLKATVTCKACKNTNAYGF